METEQIEKPKEVELPYLSKSDSIFLNHLFDEAVCYNATEAYARAHPNCTRETARRNGHKLLTKADIQAHIRVRFAEKQMGAEEAVANLTEQARIKIGFFYKVVEDWVFTPLPTHQIVDEEEVPDTRDPKGIRTRTRYKVRHFAIDLETVLDPRYSHLIKSISDSPRTGIKIELHDAQAANALILRVNGAFKDKVALTNPDGSQINLNSKDADVQYNRTLSALADALRESLSRPGVPAQGSLDTAVEAAVAGASQPG